MSARDLITAAVLATLIAVFILAVLASPVNEDEPVFTPATDAPPVEVTFP